MKLSMRAWNILLGGAALLLSQPRAWAGDISAGGYFTCGINTSGAARCWGDAANGKLGNGVTTGTSLTPVQVSGLTSGVASISSGDQGTCAVTTGGGVWCWGNGPTGVNSPSMSPVPVQPVGLSSGVAKVSVGNGSACAVMTSGQLYCWGANNSGQLGLGAASSYRSTPVLVPGLSGVIDVAVGGSHTCALLNTGAVRCFGDNTSGQLGTGSKGGTSASPVEPVGLSSGVTAVKTGGSSSCALMADGSARCWGDNAWGQLGTNDTVSRSSPAVVLIRTGSTTGMLSGLSRLTVGTHIACGLVQSSAYCWGAVGSGTSIFSVSTAQLVNNASSFSTIEAGTYAACALTPAGAAWCWGQNSAGQLGNNSTVYSYNSAVPVTGF